MRFGSGALFCSGDVYVGMWDFVGQGEGGFFCFDDVLGVGNGSVSLLLLGLGGRKMGRLEMF